MKIFGHFLFAFLLALGMLAGVARAEDGHRGAAAAENDGVEQREERGDPAAEAEALADQVWIDVINPILLESAANSSRFYNSVSENALEAINGVKRLDKQLDEFHEQQLEIAERLAAAGQLVPIDDYGRPLLAANATDDQVRLVALQRVKDKLKDSIIEMRDGLLESFEDTINQNGEWRSIRYDIIDLEVLSPTSYSLRKTQNAAVERLSERR
jgi:hypothetical protein